MTRSPKYSFRLWLAALAFAALLPATAVVGIAVWRSGQTLKTNSLELLKGSARIVAGAVEGELANEAGRLAMLASMRARPDDPARPARQDAENLPLQPTDALAPVIDRAQATGKPALSNMVRLRDDPEPKVAFVVPEPAAANGRSVSVHLISPSRLVQGLQRNERSLESFLIAVTDGNGNLIARSRDPELYTGRRVPDWDKLQSLGKRQSTFEAVTKEGDRVIFAFHEVAGTPGWIVVVGEDLGTFNARWRGPLRGVIGAGLLALGIAAAAAAWISRLILRPVGALARHAQKVAVDEGYNAPPDDARSAIREFEILRGSLRRAEIALRRRALTQRRIMEKLALNERRYRALASVGALVFWRRELPGDFIYTTGWTDLTGQEENLSLSAEKTNLIYPEDRLLVLAAWEQAISTRGQLEVEFRILAADGNWRWVRARGAPVADETGRIGEWMGVLEDVNERRQAQARIAHMAHHDALTGLANRALFEERLAEAISAHDGSGAHPAILYLDLDRFKQVNDTLGHPVGDALLKAVADRLRASVKKNDVIARLGGDEFAIIQAAGVQPHAATAMALRLIEAISQPYDVQGHRIVIGTSVGITLVRGEDTRPENLMREADMALYCAKQEGRSRYYVFDAAMDAKLQERRRMEMELRQALDGGEFDVWYQPLFSMKDRRLLGFEALLRWNHPSRGVLEPAEFMTVAEEVGLAAPISRKVLRDACAFAAQWPQAIRVAVNLLPSQLVSPGLADGVEAILRDTGLRPERLELEVTEDGLGRKPSVVFDALRKLKALGVRIIMDNFGAGRSSLGYLRAFPFDKVKIDGAFVRGLGRETDCEAIVRSVTMLCDSLGIAAAAQDVETETQFGWLSAEACNEAQGRFFSNPCPASELEERYLLMQV